MKAILSVFIVMLAMQFGGAPAGTTTLGGTGVSADDAAIRAVVGAQLEAFRVDDAEAAFGYAAPRVQQRYGSADHFMRMVRQSFRPVHRSRSVAFGDLTQSPHGPVQTVHLVGPDGHSYLAMFMMEQASSGDWRIGGCLLRRERGWVI